MNEKVTKSAIDSFYKGTYKKNIHYIFQAGASPEEFARVKMLAGSPGMSSWMIQQAHMAMGAQVHVSKQVSDDLMASDFAFASQVENVPWIAPVVELYFEDPLLPTILAMKTTPQEIQKLFPQLDVTLKCEEYITALMQEGSDIVSGRHLSLQLSPNMYNQFLMTGETDKMETGPLSMSLSFEDNCVMAFMLNLALKVFVFASIPTFKPATITRKDMHHGGKPEIKGRPTRPAMRVTYLPKIVKPAVPIGEGAESRDFYGRRGHIRCYEHKRFTHMQGKWTFIPPVANPHTGKYPEYSIIKIRKP